MLTNVNTSALQWIKRQNQMYQDQYKYYPQEYEISYNDEMDINNQYFYEYNDPNMMMSQPQPQNRMVRNIPQVRNQSYMGYQMNMQPNNNLLGNYNPNQAIQTPRRSI